MFAELEMADRFGAPGAIGRALRVARLCAGGSEGLDLLHRSVEALQPSPCRLEHAYRKLGITNRRQLTTDRIAETPPPTR